MMLHLVGDKNLQEQLLAKLATDISWHHQCWPCCSQGQSLSCMELFGMMNLIRPQYPCMLLMLAEADGGSRRVKVKKSERWPNDLVSRGLSMRREQQGEKKKACWRKNKVLVQSVKVVILGKWKSCGAEMKCEHAKMNHSQAIKSGVGITLQVPKWQHQTFWCLLNHIPPFVVISFYLNPAWRTFDGDSETFVLKKGPSSVIEHLVCLQKVFGSTSR